MILNLKIMYLLFLCLQLYEEQNKMYFKVHIWIIMPPVSHSDPQETEKYLQFLLIAAEKGAPMHV